VTSLRDLLWPRSVAIIGASSDPSALSGRPLGILLNSGYSGSIYPVNPRHREIAGLPAYSRIGDVPETVDTALVLVPRAHVLDVLAQCADSGVGLAVVFASGFAEENGLGREQERRIGEIAKSSGMRIIGPNAEGFLNTAAPMPATFSPAVEVSFGSDLRAGDGGVRAGDGGVRAGGADLGAGDGVAVISQSGGLGFAVFDRGRAAGLGFSYIVSTGNEADVDAVDVMDELIPDETVRVVLLVVEGFRSPERFLAAADRARSAGKPIAVAKLGSSAPGARAALAHTAHSAGSDLAYQAVFRGRGVVRAHDEDELIDAGMLLARTGPAPGRYGTATGRRVGIITTSGGAGVWLADACVARGLTVPELTTATQADLRALMPSYGSPRNPVDLTAEAIHRSGLIQALDRLISSSEVDSVALIMSMANPTALERIGPQLGRLLAASAKPVVVYSYTRPDERNIARLAELGLAWFPAPSRTARAIALLAGTC
jgi:acetate---CoA ligase (ADP-forming)